MSTDGAQVMQDLLDALEENSEALRENTEEVKRLRSDILEKMSSRNPDQMPLMLAKLISSFMGGTGGRR